MRVGILGYGNLGKSLAENLEKTEHRIAAVFSRRKIIEPGIPIFPREEMAKFAGQLDALIIATSSDCDATEDALHALQYFSTIDSFDNHGKIPSHKSRLDEVAKAQGRVAITAAGWDPGLLSIGRALTKIPGIGENVNTFWGAGKSLGHSAALRKIQGIKNAVQFTVPRHEARTLAKNTDAPLSPVDCHRRECFIVPEDDADTAKIEEKIRNLDGYFRGYEVAVHFISESEFLRIKDKSSHRGEVISTKISGGEKTSFDLKIEIPKNSDFTAKIMISYLNAMNYLQNHRKFGAYTPLDIPLSLLIDEKTYNNII